MKIVSINASGSYDILIGAGLLDEAGPIMRKRLGGQGAAIVCDDIVDKLYADKLAESLAAGAYRVSKYVFPHGESSKNGEVFLSLLSFLANEKLSRRDLVVALGGGVTGDLAGFAAAAYMRGIGFVQIPTTLLAAVDSSVGGKTAINLNAGKNLAGAFHQPRLVLCDVNTLASLPTEVFRDGMGELIKHGVIADRDLFYSYGDINSRVFDSQNPVFANLETIIARNVEIKAAIVMEDEFETHKRKLLNFGHTLGHAIEILSDYSTGHGQAVAAGMAIESRAAFRLGLCDESCAADIIRMLERHGLPVNTEYRAADLARACLADKKRDGESLSMIFPREIGNCEIVEIALGELEALIEKGLMNTPGEL